MHGGAPRSPPRDALDQGRDAGAGGQDRTGRQRGELRSRARRRASGAIMLDRSGARAFHALAAGVLAPMREATRVVSSQASASGAQRSATEPAAQASKASVGSHTARRRPGRPPSVSSPATDATSIEQAGLGLGRPAARAAVALRSRTASPPLRSVAGRLQAPVVEQQLRAAYDLEGRARRRCGRRARRRARWSRARAPRRAACVVVWPPRSARPTSPGRTRVPPSRGRSRRWAISSSTGVAASAGETVRRALPVVPSPPWSSTCASRARAAGAERLEAGGDVLGVGRLRRHRAQAAHPGGLVPAQRVGHPAQRAQPAGRLPDEREVDHPVDRRGRRRGLGVHDRRSVAPMWFDLQPRGHQAPRARGGVRLSSARMTELRVAAREASWAES